MKLAKWQVCLGGIGCAVATQAASLINGISVPVGSQDSGCYPVWHGVYSVSAPVDTNLGIGNLINPGPISSAAFSLHDHAYVSAYTPDPSRAVVTYEFSSPVTVDQLELIQHANGITQVEGFVGNSLGSLTSIGSVFGPAGDVTGYAALSEGASQVFDFDNTLAGTIFQFVVRKTNLDGGWANYRAFPRREDGVRFEPQTLAVPEPRTYGMAFGLGLAGFAIWRRQPARKS